MKIDDLNIEDRPRERMIKYGPKGLSDVELLAIILGSGTKEENVLDLSANILKRYCFKDMKDLSYHELIKISGIKQAKACKLLSCFEIAKRAIKNEDINITLEDSNEIYRYIKNDFYLESNEKLCVIFLDVKLKVIYKLFFDGNSPHNILLPMKNIVKEAFKFNASCIIIAHNHPSNDVSPSIKDIEETIKLKNVLHNMDMLLVDHLIIGSRGYYSFNDNGLLLDDF